MATGEVSNHFKYKVGTGGILLQSDQFKIHLMKSGFVFDRDGHATMTNIAGVFGPRTDVSFEAAQKRIKTVAGNFITAGCVINGKITVTGSANNNVTFTIFSVDSTTQLTVIETVVDEVAGNSVTITMDDELATANGYTKDTKVLTGIVVTEDDANDRMELTCDNVQWVASGGSIGPSPGAIIEDETSSDDTIVGYINFGSDQTATIGTTFTISNIRIRLA